MPRQLYKGEWFYLFFQVGRWKAQSSEVTCWRGRASQCWCQIWALVPFPLHVEGTSCGANQQHTPASAHGCVRSTVTLPTSVHKQWSQQYPLGCPEEIHTQELDIRVVHKLKSIDLASGRDFLNSRFAETDAICKVYPGVIYQVLGYWTLSAHQEQLFSTLFSPEGPCIHFQWRLGLVQHI